MSQDEIVLVVDDDPINVDIVQEFLGNDYVTETAFTGEECLKKAKDVNPNIILLDVDMPKMTGYEACKKLKDDKAFASVPVIFLSALATLDDRMAGYEAGGQDYITKPFEPEELLVKIKLLLEGKTSAMRLQKRVKEATEVAMTAMKGSGELGVVVKFLRQCFPCKTFEELGECLVAATNALGVNNSVQIRYNHDSTSLNRNGLCAPLEADLLAICKDKGRIIKIQHRTFINYPNISMLLKDMPTDEDAYGQLLDHLTVLAEGANEKTEVLIKDSDARNQQQKEALETARETGQEINDEFKEYCEKTSKILNNLVDEIEK